MNETKQGKIFVKKERFHFRLYSDFVNTVKENSEKFGVPEMTWGIEDGGYFCRMDFHPKGKVYYYHSKHQRWLNSVLSLANSLK